MSPDMLDLMTKSVQAFADGAIVGYLNKETIDSNPYDGFIGHNWEQGFKHGSDKYLLEAYSDVKTWVEITKGQIDDCLKHSDNYDFAWSIEAVCKQNNGY